jgi:hypothetical protein
MSNHLSFLVPSICPQFESNGSFRDQTASTRFKDLYLKSDCSIGSNVPARSA